MECSNIKQKTNRYEAKLPDKFGSTNTRSVQVFLSDDLQCVVWSRSISNIDIFGLVSHLVFDCEDNESVKENLYKAKKWICENLNFTEYLGNYTPQPEVEDPLGWLKKVKKQRPKQLRDIDENQIYDDSILNQYVMMPHYKYYLEGLSYEIQTEYQIGFDLLSERIVFPIYNQYGDIISVKGRTMDENYKEKNIPKFMYLYPYNKTIEWYNWNLALYEILEKREVIVFEAEKSCWYAAEFGYRNTLAIGGSDITLYQVELIKKLPYDTKIILAFDKDKEEKDIRKEADKFGLLRPIHTFWDKKNLLSKDLKHSPTDLGKEVFDFLYQDSIHRRINKSE